MIGGCRPQRLRFASAEPAARSMPWAYLRPFHQGAKKEGSTGLGLAAVDAVCRLYSKVAYPIYG